MCLARFDQRRRCLGLREVRGGRLRTGSVRGGDQHGCEQQSDGKETRHDLLPLGYLNSDAAFAISIKNTRRAAS